MLHSGKVRDIYYYDENHLLFHTTDRISAFDVILPSEIPGKGVVLNQLTEFWMKRFEYLFPNHLSKELPPVAIGSMDQRQLQVVKKLDPIPVEAIVRGYLVGSGWKEYQQTGRVCGVVLPEGLRLGEKLPEPIFTPSTKEQMGGHDVNISFTEMQQVVGGLWQSDVIKTISLRIYKEAAEYALERGIIIADTKFEFGYGANGVIRLMDEVLTPDSSRFWSVDEYEVGISPPSYDKQIVRDYLETLDWDKKPPGPELPKDVIDKTASRYQEVAKLLTS